MVVNRADKPLYLMPGEVLVGGQQDRTISEETVIAATGKPVAIDVYCVERGRWSRRSAGETEAMLSELPEHAKKAKALSREAARGKFVAKGGYLDKSSRMSAQAREGQGKVWEKGYVSGALQAPVYADVPVALRRFREQGRDVSIYSSGSVLAQKLLFSHTDAGDLTPLLHAYFDTTTGPKRERASYAAIAKALSRRASEVLFVSDVVEELDAARAAHLGTALCVRPEAPRPIAPRHHVITSLEEL